MTQMEERVKKFEQLPEVHKKIGHLQPTIIWFGDDGLYRTSFNFQDTVNWLNGAFYVYNLMLDKEQ